MNRLVHILSKEDHELCHQINLIQGIKPHYYAFRWITLLLSQEFSLPGNDTYIGKFCFHKLSFRRAKTLGLSLF